jgi:hypothetical protein
MVFRVGPIKLDNESPFLKQEWNQTVLDQLKDLYTNLGLAGTVTVANLPAAASNTYARRFVSDANATAFYGIVAGGGANIVPVFSDGTNWRIG